MVRHRDGGDHEPSGLTLRPNRQSQLILLCGACGGECYGDVKLEATPEGLTLTAAAEKRAKGEK